MSTNLQYHHHQQQQSCEASEDADMAAAPAAVTPFMKRFLLILNCMLLALGNCGGPQLTRLYFVHGGHRVWFTACLETAAFPLILLPLSLLTITTSTKRSNKPKLFFSMNLRIFIFSFIIGLLTGLDDYLYAYGVAFLPVSTSALVIASQLAFTALFAFLLVKQKFTPYSINAVVLLVVGAAVLGLNASGDRPKGVSKKEYVMGFFMTLSASALYGFVLPAVELMYKKGKTVVSYRLVLEVQLVMCFFATLFCAVGMFFHKDFQAIPREAKEYGLGEARYYVVVVWNAIFWQCFFLGAIGVVFCASSLLSGIIIAVLLPVTETLAVIIFHDKFQAAKAVALVLALWGFVSYFYGEIKQTRKVKKGAAAQSLPGSELA